MMFNWMVLGEIICLVILTFYSSIYLELLLKFSITNPYHSHIPRSRLFKMILPWTNPFTIELSILIGGGHWGCPKRSSVSFIGRRFYALWYIALILASAVEVMKRLRVLHSIKTVLLGQIHLEALYCGYIASYSMDGWRILPSQ